MAAVDPAQFEVNMATEDTAIRRAIRNRWHDGMDKMRKKEVQLKHELAFAEESVRTNRVRLAEVQYAIEAFSVGGTDQSPASDVDRSP